MDAVVSTLKEIEAVAPSKESYSNLCLLLTVNKLSDHPEYRSWNPSKGRVDCFRSGHYYLNYIFFPIKDLCKCVFYKRTIKV